MGILRDKALDKIQVCQNIVMAKHNILLQPIEVTFKYEGNNGTAAMAAHYPDGKQILLLNLYYLENYTDDFIKQTIPHEMCHLLCYKKYKESSMHPFGHGFYWKKEMRETFKLMPYINNIYGVEHIWKV